MNDLRLREFNYSLEDYYKLNKNAEIIRISLCIVNNKNIYSYVEKELNRFADDEIYQALYLLCEYIEENFEDNIIDYLEDNIENIMKNFEKEFCDNI